ncbi:MAG: hypothetical protein LBT46_00025 [Planctomycetaceae bacterium]|nr:hypothetical protein [Planctomycetaceae bacterium]
MMDGSCLSSADIVSSIPACPTWAVKLLESSHVVTNLMLRNKSNKLQWKS